MRVQSGQTAVLGGLMQDAVTNIEDTIPGVRQVPGVGQLLAQRKDINQKTELVIFLRPTVIRDDEHGRGLRAPARPASRRRLFPEARIRAGPPLAAVT